MFEDLIGKSALITGGARGLGLGMAQALAGCGVHVGLVDILDSVEQSARKVADEYNVTSVAVIADLTDQRQVVRAFDEVEAGLGAPVDILVNSAGVSVFADAIDISPEQWQRVMDINLGATWACAQIQAQRSRDRGRAASIINIASMSSFIVNVPQHQTAYNVSKAAVSMLTKCLAVEWLPLQIRVNAIAPGYFASDITRQFTDQNPELGREWVSRIPLGRMGEPPELGGLVAYLASDESSYVVGQSYVIDGGFTIV
ncbi:MAG: SDR family oxidoreductase [Arachnia sp.]